MLEKVVDSKRSCNENIFNSARHIIHEFGGYSSVQIFDYALDLMEEILAYKDKEIAEKNNVCEKMDNEISCLKSKLEENGISTQIR